MRGHLLALIYSESIRLLKSSACYAVVFVASALALMTALSSPDECNALLFMVAGDDPSRIGGAIGFIGNLIDSGNVVGSAVRTSLVFTIAWIFVVIIYSVFVTAQDYTAASYAVSKARGLSEMSMVAAKFIVHSVFCCLLYLISCFIAFVCKTFQYGIMLSFEGIGDFAYPALLSAIVLATIFTETAALYQLIRRAYLTVVVSVTLSLFILMWFPSSYSGDMSSVSPILYLFPVFYLMNICALCIQSVGIGTIATYAALTCAITLFTSTGALKWREVF